MGEDRIGECRLLGAVHLRLDHIDRAGAAVARALGLLQVVDGAGHRDHRVHQPLGRGLPVLAHDIGGHQMAHVAHQEQGAPLQRHGAAIGAGDGAVTLQAAGHDLAALLEALGQVALHQAQPVAIDADLVLGIDGGDAVLAILDGRQRRLQHDIAQPAGRGRADRVIRIDHQFDMQPVVAQDVSGIGPVAAGADEGRRIGQPQRLTPDRRDQPLRIGVIGGDIGMAAALQRQGLVQEGGGLRDHRIAPRRIEAARGHRPHHVRPVHRVIERAPPRIGRVQRKTRIADRHDQLRPGQGGDLGVDGAVLDGEGGGFGDQIADLGQEGAIGGRVPGLVPARLVPGVDARLHLGPDRQQVAVAAREAVQQGGIARPEGVRRHIGARQHPILDEGGEIGMDVQAVARCDGGHDGLLQGRESVRHLGDTSAGRLCQALWKVFPFCIRAAAAARARGSGGPAARPPPSMGGGRAFSPDTGAVAFRATARHARRIAADRRPG